MRSVAGARRARGSLKQGLQLVGQLPLRMRAAEQAQAFDRLLAPTLEQQLLDVCEPVIRRELQVAA